MKKIIVIILGIITISLMSANTIKSHIYQEPIQYSSVYRNYESSIMICNKNLIEKISANGKIDIIYKNPEILNNIEGKRNTLLRLEFNIQPTRVYIFNNDNFYTERDATWLNNTTAEIFLPEGEYCIASFFISNNINKLVIKDSIDLFSVNQVELTINDNEACNYIECNSCDINGELFNYDNGYTSFFSYSYQDNLVFFSIILSDTGMYVSDFTENIVLLIGEQSIVENTITNTQYGPFSEIISNRQFTNSPDDYVRQAISLYIPDSIDNPIIAPEFTFWVNFPESSNRFYSYTFFYPNAIAVNENNWDGILYMMENSYQRVGTTSRVSVGSMPDNYINNYSTAPFHCIDNLIGSFFNISPTEIDYLCDTEEALIFGEPLTYISNIFYFADNFFYLSPYIKGYKQEYKTEDWNNSSYVIKDSLENIIGEGSLWDLWSFELTPAKYTLIIENSNFSFGGLEGMAKIQNNFDSSLDSPIPPFINAFQIRDENNVPQNQLKYNENGSLLFSIADYILIDNHMIYSPITTDSITVYYKEHYETTWNELNFELLNEYGVESFLFGKIFSADLSELTGIDSVVYDLKICIEDIDENYTEFIIKPAFVVGDFDVSSLNDETIKRNNKDNLTNYPNPFNPTTTISYDFGEKVKLRNPEINIYNTKGQEIKSIKIPTNEITGTAIWNGKNENGNKVGSGIYLYTLKNENSIYSVNKMILIK